MVCKEGYAGNPTQLLGAYCFCRRVPVADCGAEAPPVELVARPGVPAGQMQVGELALLGRQRSSLRTQWFASSACWPGRKCAISQGGSTSTAAGRATRHVEYCAR